MKKIIISITFIISIIAVIFAVLEVNDYYSKKEKNKINGNIIEVEEKIKKAEQDIKTNEEKEKKLIEDNKGKLEELDVWQKKVKEIESYLS